MLSVWFHLISCYGSVQRIKKVTRLEFGEAACTFRLATCCTCQQKCCLLLFPETIKQACVHCVNCCQCLDSTIAALAFVAPSKLRHDSANTVCGQTDLLVSNITKQWHGSKFYICGHTLFSNRTSIHQTGDQIY